MSRALRTFRDVLGSVSLVVHRQRERRVPNTVDAARAVEKHADNPCVPRTARYRETNRKTRVTCPHVSADAASQAYTKGVVYTLLPWKGTQLPRSDFTVPIHTTLA